MELSVAPSSAHCAATTISSSFSKLCFNFPSRSRMLNRCSRKLPSCVVVLCTLDLLSCATLLCFSGRRSVATSFSRSKSMLQVRIAWPAVRAVYRPFLSRHSKDSPSLFDPRLAGPVRFFQDFRAGEADVEPPSRRVRSGMRVLRKPLCYVWSSSAQPRGVYF